jgi:serine/threonine protein kinase
MEQYLYKKNASRCMLGMDGGSGVQALLNELELMARLQHPHIVRIHEYFLQDDPSLPHCGACVMVLDLLEGPDMMDYIDQVGGFTRDDAIVRLFFIICCPLPAYRACENLSMSSRRHAQRALCA